MGADRSFFLVLGVAWLGPALRLFAGPIEADVRDLVSRHGFEPSKVAVVIVSQSGKLVVAMNDREPFQPASNQKVLTTAAALYWLGLDHEFETTLSSRGALKDGLLQGDLIVRGKGDPNISGRFHGGDPAAIFKGWALQLREKSLGRIKGDVIVDDGYFDDARFPATWDRKQEETWYSAQISALSLNDNCVDIIVRPASRPGEPARVEALPSSPLLQVEGAPLTAAEGHTSIIVHRKPGTNRISVKGQINARGPAWIGNVTVDDPALIFGSVLAQVLRNQGIKIDGEVRKIERGASPAILKDGPGFPGVASASGREENASASRERLLLKYASTLREDLPVILKRSQNLHAEILLKAMGAKVAGEGSIAGGEEALRRFLKAKKIGDEGLVVRDGSGLSHQNRVSAALLAKVLHSVKSEKYFPEFLHALPAAGEDGTLDERFKGLPELKGKIFAKTGYISGVSCLSGYVVRGNSVWSFSVLVNGLKGGAHEAKRLQEKIGERIYQEMP